jgi:phosphocarrier protein
VQIRNRRGLHARASAKFVTLASQLPARITVTKDGSEVTGTSIMGLMMLGAAMGDSIEIAAEGDDHEKSLDQLCALVEDKFGEE